MYHNICGKQFGQNLFPRFGRLDKKTGQAEKGLPGNGLRGGYFCAVTSDFSMPATMVYKGLTICPTYRLPAWVTA